jgi:tetratricopeptide (TPR) repeat protein
MQKKQIIVILAAIIGVGIVFSLPKVLVDNKKEEVKGGEATISTKDSLNDISKLMAEKHTHKPSSQDQKNIVELTKKYYSVSDKEKKRIFADSISGYYKQFHQYDSVAKYSEEVAVLFPGAQNWVTAADAYMQASDLVPAEEKTSYSDKSRELYKKALELSPDDLDIKSKLAMTYVATSNPMAGIKLLQEVIKESPDNQTALFNLGYLSMQSGQYNKAVDRFKKLTEVNPKHASGTFYLGLSYLQLGNKDKAKGYFEKAKTLDHDPEFQSIIDSYVKETN